MKNALFLVGLCLVGLVLRLWDITKSSIWNDEGFSVMLAKLPPLEIIELTARDVHPPLYYVLLHYWMVIGGNNELVIRSLSVVCTLLIIPLAYLLIHKLWNRRAGQLAALFVTCGPMLVRYAQEARMYALAAFLVLLATYCLVKAVERNQWQWWVGYALALTAGLYTHYYILFMLPLYIGWVATRAKKAPLIWKKWWTSNALVIVLFAAWLPILYAQFTRGGSFSWLPPVTAWSVIDTSLQFVLHSHMDNISRFSKLGLALLVLVGLMLVWRFTAAHRQSLLFLVGYWLITPLSVLALAILIQAPYLDRYFVFASVGFYCLLGAVIASVKPRWQIVAATLVIGMLSYGNYSIHRGGFPAMRPASAYVNQNYQPGDQIVTDSLLTYFDFDYYNHTGATTQVWLTYRMDGYRETSLLHKRADQVLIPSLSEIDPSSNRVWIISKLNEIKYTQHIPAHWQPLTPIIKTADIGVQLFYVAPREQP